MQLIKWCCGTRGPVEHGHRTTKPGNHVRFNDKMEQEARQAQMRINIPNAKGKSGGNTPPSPASPGTPGVSPANAYPMDQLDLQYRVTFNKESLLGAGHFAQVYRGESVAIDEKTGKPVPVAVKRILRSRTKSSILQREIAAMLKVRNITGVVKLYDVFFDKTYMVLVLELLEGGELFQRIVNNGAYSERDASKHVRMIASALQAMHDSGVVHRDLKPENLILCTNEANSPIKIADFGLSRILGEDQSVMHTICGTRAYAAPEVNFTGAPQSAEYTAKIDMWSVGVILFVVLAGYHPFDEFGTADKTQVWDRICRGKWSFNDACWASISKGAKDLIEKLIETDPESRFSAAQVLQHPWITRFHDIPTVPLKSLSVRSLRTFIPHAEPTAEGNDFNMV